MESENNKRPSVVEIVKEYEIENGNSVVRDNFMKKHLHAHDVIRNRLLESVIDKKNVNPDPRFSLHSLSSTEWSKEFETLMRNRLVIGAFRYGLLHGENKPKWDRIEYAHRKLQRYIETGNQEALVDVANLMLLEFEEGCHPLKHFGAMDETNEHAIIKK